MTSNGISTGKPKGSHLISGDNASDKSNAEHTLSYTKKNQLSSADANKNLTTRKASKISDINGADDFKNWLASECVLVSLEAEKAIMPINVVKKKFKAVIPIIAIGLLLGAAAILFGVASLGIFVTIIFCLLSMGIIFGTGVFAYRTAINGTTEEQAIAKMTPMLLQEAVKELFNNEQLNDITSDDYRELAKAVSASFKEAEIIGDTLASKLMTSLSKFNPDDKKSNILTEITSESTNFIKLAFERLDFYIENEELAKKIAITKKNFLKQGDNSFKKSESLNKFTKDIYKFVENYNKKRKGKIHLIKIKKNEMENAIQTGLNNYFSSLEGDLPTS